MERARVVLVTNVGQGFGRAVALAYGRAGYHVVCADRDVDLASKTAAEVEELGGQAIPIQADMTTQMDVLTTYHKVLEIFGALGGVVHLAEHVNTTPFENMAEAEFFEVMAETVRSSFLVLKTAARLLSVGWVVIVAPPVVDSVQMHAVQGALTSMAAGFRQRFTYPRANVVVPSRLSSDPRHDQALVRAVRYFGSLESSGVSGQAVVVDLPEPPRVAEALLPEVRAALDVNARQEDDYVQPWELDEDDVSDRPEAAGASAVAEAEQDNDSGQDDDAHEYETFDLLWTHELGLVGRPPALRHMVADEGDPPNEDAYTAGLEPAVDLYGDLSRLEGSGFESVPFEGGEGSYDPNQRRAPAFEGEDVFKKR
ncbi:MAG TPA: SDR family NAD(P)-dependent oxidoreductase [Trueperaceae bacterium]|nr:SDR family NAD(P)-dependent oxidoreductase [Trueperaceae bacterium]